MKFSNTTRDRLGFYVYALVDPGTEMIFYIGKASGNNRAFDHLKQEKGEDEKVGRIREIRAKGQQPIVEILRFGLTNEREALEIEAAAIDTIGLENLTNQVRGHHTDRGRRRATELERIFGSRPIDIGSYTDPTILFFIHNTYSPTLTEQEVYDCTRQFWTGIALETRMPRNPGLNYKTALAIVDSVAIRAYEIQVWLPGGSTMSSRSIPTTSKAQTWEFVGNLLADHPLVGRRLEVKGEPLPGSQNGFRYLPLRGDA